jgi:hypothetical protein
VCFPARSSVYYVATSGSKSYSSRDSAILQLQRNEHRKFDDELFSLTPLDSTCYSYAMDYSHYLPSSLEIGRDALLIKTSFDGTKLPLVYNDPRTTTGGMLCYLRLYSNRH